MAVFYAMVERANPQNALVKKWYPQVEVQSNVKINQLASEIAYSTAMTDADVLAVVRAFIAVMKNHLRAGDSVTVGDLGTFQFQIQAEGSETEFDFSVAKIKKTMIRFLPGVMLKEVTNGLTYKQTIMRKDLNELIKP